MDYKQLLLQAVGHLEGEGAEGLSCLTLGPEVSEARRAVLDLLRGNSEAAVAQAQAGQTDPQR